MKVLKTLGSLSLPLFIGLTTFSTANFSCSEKDITAEDSIRFQAQFTFPFITQGHRWVYDLILCDQQGLDSVKIPNYLIQTIALALDSGIYKLITTEAGNSDSLFWRVTSHRWEQKLFKSDTLAELLMKDTIVVGAKFTTQKTFFFNSVIKEFISSKESFTLKGITYKKCVRLKEYEDEATRNLNFSYYLYSAEAGMLFRQDFYQGKKLRELRLNDINF